jgi:hypothetical protein
MSDRSLPPELRQELLSKLPFSATSTVEYTPDIFKDITEEYKPVFTIRSWTRNEAKIVMSSQGKIDVEKAREYTRKATVGWRNVFDAGSGNEIDYVADSTTGCDKALWDALPDTLYVELFKYVSQISGLALREKTSLVS